MLISPVIKNAAGIILVIWGYLDGYKYHLNASKIRQVKSSNGHSRKFINLALGNDFYKILYFLLIDPNYYMILVSALASVFMLELWWETYRYYPYHRYPKKCIVKRPNIFLYIWNSLIPNRHRRHL